MKKNGFAPIIIILVIVIIGVIGYFGYNSIPTKVLVQKRGFFEVNKNDWINFKSDSYKPQYGEGESVKFSIMYPSDWKYHFDNKGLFTRDDELVFGHGFVFSKDNYELRIGLGYAKGGDLCVFPDDTWADKENLKLYGDSFYNDFKEIPSLSSSMKLRRVQGDSQSTESKFIVCAADLESNPLTFGTVTKLGKVMYIVPENSDPSILNIMDNIVSSISTE